MDVRVWGEWEIIDLVGRSVLLVPGVCSQGCDSWASISTQTQAHCGLTHSSGRHTVCHQR